MELEEAEDEEWNITTTSQHCSEPSSGGNVNCVVKRGLTLGKKILVAGFVASSAPIVLPPLVVASAIGLAVSMPYALFLASHTCTQNLMSKLLPKPTPHGGPPLLEDTCFQPDIDIAHKSNEDLALKGEAKRNNEMVDFNEKLGDKIYGGEEGHIRIGESDGEQPMNGKFGNEIGRPSARGSHQVASDGIEEFKTPFEFGVVTSVVLEECCDEVKEGGDIEEDELQRETKGLLEKIRDEGRSDMRGECVEGIQRNTNESDQNMGPVVENMVEVEQENEGEMRNEEDSKVCEEMLQLRNGDNMDIDTVFNEVESGESVSGILEVDGSNDLLKPMAETSDDSEVLDGRGFQYETILAEPIGDLLIEAHVFNIPIAEDSSEVSNDKTDKHEIFRDELEPTILQKGKSDDNISDYVNQEMQLNEDSKIMDLSDADAREIADESGMIPLCDENRIDGDTDSYTIDLHEESSNVTVDAHTDSMEVLVSSVEPESRSSECSSGKNIICPSEEVLLNEGDIWKQIHAIRKIIGYEGTTHASCTDELKALYIFTGVEPPTFLKENPFDPAEINEKLHFLMSIVGIKSNLNEH